MKLPTFVSPFPDPLEWAVNVLSIPLDSILPYAYPVMAFLPQIVAKNLTGLGVLVAPDKSWMANLLMLAQDFHASSQHCSTSWNSVVCPCFTQHQTSSIFTPGYYPLSCLQKVLLEWGSGFLQLWRSLAFQQNGRYNDLSWVALYLLGGVLLL